MISRWWLACALVAALATSATSAPLLLESYEGFNDGEIIGAATSVTTGPAGVTEGSQAAISDIVAGYQQIANVNLNVTLPDARIAAGERVTQFSVDVLGEVVDTGGFLQIVAGFFFSSDSSFDQVDGFKTGSSDSFLGAGTSVTTIFYDENGSNFNFGTQTSTPVLPIFDKINSELAAGNFVGFGIYASNGGADAMVTLDNIQANVIPEPATAAVVGLLGVAALTRRRV